MLLRSFFLVACVSHSAAIAQYTVDFLPTPNGDGLVNDAGGGQIVGAAFGPGGGPALWDGPNYNYIPLHAAGYSDVHLEGVGGGKQVGWGFSNTTRALMWSGSAATVLDLHPVGFVGSVAMGTDGKTQVGAASPSGFNSHAMLWRGTAASAVSLHPAGYENSQALDAAGDI